MLSPKQRPQPQTSRRSSAGDAEVKQRMYDTARRNELLYEAITGEPMPDSLKRK